jgi:MFS family permease
MTGATISTHITKLSEIVALGILVTIGNLTPYALPVIVGSLVDYMQLTPQMAGYLGTAELVGLGLGATLFSWVILRVNWRLFTLVAMSMSVAAALLTPFTHNLPLLFVVRFVAGLGGGMLLSMAAAGLSSTKSPERTLGSVQIFGMMFSGVALSALPRVLDQMGMVAMFSLIAAVNVAAMALIFAMPRRSPYVEGMANATPQQLEQAAISPRHAPPRLLISASTLAGIFLYFCAAMGYWIYYERVGVAADLSVANIGNVLGASQLFGAAGALAAALVATRLGARIVPMMFSILLAMACAFAMTRPVDLGLYALAAFGFNFSWGFIYPYMMGVAISLDPSARIVGYALALQTIGKAVGPALVASLVVGTVYTGGYWLCLGLFLASLISFIPAILHTDGLLRQQRRGGEVPATA